jgi:hypothetical protein
MKALVIVAAVLVSSSLGCAASAPCSHVAKPVSVEGERPLTVRTDAGTVWVGAHTWSEAHRAWEKPACGPIQDLSIEATATGHAITFAQGGLVWRGELDENHRARGPLTIVRDLGTTAQNAGFAGNP